MFVQSNENKVSTATRIEHGSKWNCFDHGKNVIAQRVASQLAKMFAHEHTYGISISGIYFEVIPIVPSHVSIN